MDSLIKPSSTPPEPKDFAAHLPPRRSLMGRLLLLFTCLVGIPLVVAGALLTLVARNSVTSTGDELSRISQQAYRRSTQQLIGLAEESSRESSEQLMELGQRQMRDLGASQARLGQKALQESGERMAEQASRTMRSSTDRLVATNRQVLQRSNERLRALHLEGVNRVSAALGAQAQEALTRSGLRFAEQSRASTLKMVTQLNLERSRHIAERVSQFLALQWNQLAEGARRLARVYSRVGTSARLRVALATQERASWRQLALVNPQGRVEAIEPEGDAALLEPSQDVSSLPSYRQALRGGGAFSLEYAGSGEPYLVLTARVPLEGSSRPGVLYGYLKLDSLQSLVQASSLDGKTPAPAFVATTKGEILAHTDRSLVGRRIPPADRPLLRAAVAQRAGCVQYDATPGEPILAAYNRVEGDVSWFAAAVQPLEEVLRGVRDAEAEAKRIAAAAAREMEAQARKDAARIVQESIPAQEQASTQAARQVRLESQRLMASAANRMRAEQRRITSRAMQGASTQAARTSERALSVMGAHSTAALRDSAARLRDRSTRSADEGLREMESLTTGAANRSAGRMLVHSGWLLAFFVVVALVVAAVTARSLVRPISQLVAGTEAIASGDFGSRVPIGGDDELGRLALAFNEMASNIERSRYELECSNRVLEQEKRLIQAIVESSPDGMVLLDRDDGIVFLNPAAIRLLAPLPSTNGDDGPVPSDHVRQQVAWCLHAGPAGVQPKDVCLPGPPRRVLQVRCIPVTSVTGPTYGRLLHLRDVTREREIDEMKTNFVSLVSHELRTPLTSILGFSSYMLTGKLGDLTGGQRTGLESVHRQANRLKAIISDFLDVSRIESGQVRMRSEPVRLADVAARVLEDLRHQANEKRITLRMDGVDITRPAIALGDEERITQVFTNLLSNAIKFTEPEGTVTVVVEAVESGVRAQVSDTGVGIPAEELDRIFDRFYQVEKVVTRKTGGTGLGLAIVRNIVEAHGGTIDVESRVGEGTTFTVVLPAPEPAQAGVSGGAS